MTHDVYEPLALYRSRFRKEHAENTAAFFEELLRRSGVDEAANAVTIANLDALNAQFVAANASRSTRKTLRIFVIALAAAACLGVVVFGFPLLAQAPVPSLRLHALWTILCAVVAGAGIALVITKLTPAIHALDEQLQLLSKHCKAMESRAWEQMAPLNRLYDWDMVASIIQKTVPHLKLDPFFSRARLDDLYDSFGWSDSFNQDSSIIFAQSGEINGNPFVLAETLNFTMGTETYYGSRTISWRERQAYIDAKGRAQTRWVTRFQTLHANIQKPAPKYTRSKFLVYGNEAAPALTFSRSPSDLSGDDDNLRGKWRMKRTLAKLKKFSRNLDDDSGYTTMSNREFEALFHATDRNNEIQFRLLFTPLAQQRMVNLLRDKVSGFGDDFFFIKDQMINLVWSAQLANADITAAPDRFRTNDLATARELFNTYSNDYFRSFYFSLAPLLTIPLYQRRRPHVNTLQDAKGRRASYWEHEAIANFHGQDAFKNPASITENILKTAPASNGVVAVTAHGFRAVGHVEHIAKFGGDGRWHNVPIEWVEYLPVSSTSSLVIRETTGLTRQDFEQQTQTSKNWQAFFRQWRTKPQHATFRRSIVSFIPPR